LIDLRPAFGGAARSGNAGPCGADVLVCAGLDPSGGAGILADVRVIDRLGARPCGVVTALTVQSTLGAAALHPVDHEILGEQLAALLGDIEVRAVKLGLLGSERGIDAIAHALDMTAAPVVWDPIAGASLGTFGASFGASPIAYGLGALGKHLALITPNVPELAALTNAPIESIEAAAKAGQALARYAGCAVLVKGGHLAIDPPHRHSAMLRGPGPALAIDLSIDLLCTADAVDELSGPRIAGGEHVHGTGCALSSAIAAHLALGATLPEACRAAKTFVAALIEAPARPGRGAAAVL
jgi:hydroxymethylpyrimidine/phosphomethylpyrimidine kinase